MPTLLQISPTDGQTGSYTFRDDDGNVRGCPARVAATEENAEADIAAWLAGWRPVDAEGVVNALLAAAQRRLDAFANSWGYDTLARACTYLGDPNPRFAAEAAVLRDWRSAVWTWLAAHQGELDPAAPPTEEDFLAMLPVAPARPTP